MKAIAANKVEGFPPPDKLRTVYVEHDIQVTAGKKTFRKYDIRDIQELRGEEE